MSSQIQASKPKQRPHALVIAFPAQGHIGPMMHFSIRLAAQEGFLITFANTQFNHEDIKKDLEPALQRYEKLESEQIKLVEVRDTSRESGSTSGASSIVELGQSIFSLTPSLEQLIESLSTGPHPVTCLVSDLYLYFTQDIADKYRLPRLAFWTASAGTLASMMAVEHGHRSSPADPERITWIPGVPPLKHSELNSFIQPFDHSDFMFHHFFSTTYRRLPETTWVAMNTFDELEQASVAALRADLNDTGTPVYSIGPLLPDAYFDGSDKSGLESYPHVALWPEDHACIQWLDRQRAGSVLYVSFGSIALLTKQQFQELALGLEASGSPLLWVIRPDLLHGEDSLFPEGLLDRLGADRACFVEWAPQLQVLTHASVGGFLTHCGWNSTLESLSAGVPMLGWPYFADQMLNNRCSIDAWGAALEFQATELTDSSSSTADRTHIELIVAKEEIEVKVRALMAADSPVRVKAKQWKGSAKRAYEGSSHAQWKKLVHAMATSVEGQLSSASLA